MATISTGTGTVTVTSRRVGILLVACGGTKDGEELDGKMQEGAEAEARGGHRSRDFKRRKESRR